MYAVSFAEVNFWVRRNDNFAFLVAIFLTFSLPTSDRHNETSMTSVYSYEEHDNRPLESAGLGKKTNQAVSEYQAGFLQSQFLLL